MTRCARCDWTPVPDAGPHRAQLAGHATDAGHPLCPVPRPTHSDPDGICGRSLASTDCRWSCEGCLSATREHLAVIRDLTAELPAHLRTVSSSALGGSRGGDGRPLPGGAALALLGPGNHGGAARSLTTGDVKAGKDGREHQADNHPDDTASVSWSLMTWCLDWSEIRGDGAYVG